jgi:putative tricarboxylic transport membrane protein
MKNRESIMAIFWILLGMTIAVWSATFPFGNLEDPGPAYFPTALGMIIVAMGVLLLIRERKTKEADAARISGPAVFRRAAARRVVLYLAGMTVSAILLEVLGFVLTMFLMILFMMRTISPQKWKTAFFYSFISALGSLVVFRVLLKTQLPGGFLGF